MVKYVLVCAFASDMSLDFSSSTHDNIDGVKSELIRMDLDNELIDEILSFDSVCDNGSDDLCYWKLIEVEV